MGIAHPVTDFSKSAVTFSYLGDQEAWLKGSRLRRTQGAPLPDRLQPQPADDQEPERAVGSDGSRSSRQTVS
jgi:hypothetical protein